MGRRFLIFLKTAYDPLIAVASRGKSREVQQFRCALDKSVSKASFNTLLPSESLCSDHMYMYVSMKGLNFLLY